jgi:phenylpropionate dioxygenase-like ring-hydroxylating dioxygenase large terminal subunit
MFVRNLWYVAGWTHQIPAGEIVARTILGEPVIFYRTASGEIAALEDRCCHRFAPLSRGRLEGDDIRCMYHGLKFAASGQCVEIPSQEKIPTGVAVRSYPVVEQDRWVWVWMGDAALADVSVIPRAIGHDDPDYMVETGELHYDANYQLIHDNLLDLTHLSYVHENTLGRKSTKWGQEQPIFTPLERGVRVQRWLRDHTAASYMPAPEGTRMDHWASYDFVLPGVFLLTTSSYTVGTAEAFPAGPVGVAPAYVSVTSQAITPITDRSTIYYYSGGQPTRHAAADRIRDQVKLFDTAFREDKTMIEAQQKIIDVSPGKWMMTLGFDRSVAQFRRLMAKLMEAEVVAGERVSGGQPSVAAE